MVKLGDADAMLCGLHGRFDVHLDHIREVIGLKPGAPGFATLNALMLPQHTIFIADFQSPQKNTRFYTAGCSSAFYGFVVYTL